MDSNTKEELKKELDAVLRKYGVGIAFSCDGCSDTYAIYDAKITVIDRSGAVLAETSGWCMEPGDIYTVEESFE